jgi:hypothetical protein
MSVARIRRPSPRSQCGKPRYVRERIAVPSVSLERRTRGQLIRKYKRRWEQIYARQRAFDPRLVSEQGRNVLEEEDAGRVSEDQKALRHLGIQVVTTNRLSIMLWVAVSDR